MDQVKIGKFISECRKNKNLTQMQLAEKLNITDRAISKWENGKGMPDSSIMLDLCNILGISVNELLSGEVINMEEYNKNAEKNIIGLKKEIERKDKITKKTVLGILLLIVLIALIAVLANTYRKYSIIKDLQNTFSETSSSENYFMKISSIDENNWTTTEIYVKGNKKFIQREVYDYSGEVEIAEYVYQDGNTYNRYIESNEGKEAELNVEGNYPVVNFMNNLESESNLETFIAALWAHIEKDEYLEKECYVISNFAANGEVGLETTEVIVEVETGLCLEKIIDDCSTEYTYEFDNVDNEVFEEPDISEYTIIEEE